jgi:hypothetical protein
VTDVQDICIRVCSEQGVFGKVPKVESLAAVTMRAQPKGTVKIAIEGGATDPEENGVKVSW